MLELNSIRSEEFVDSALLIRHVGLIRLASPDGQLRQPSCPSQSRVVSPGVHFRSLQYRVWILELRTFPKDSGLDMRYLITFVSTLTLLLSCVLAVDPAPITQSSLSANLGHSERRDELVKIVDQVKGSVVNIHSERTVTQAADDPFRLGLLQPQRVNGMGTGIVLDPRGYIVTNYHVVDDVQSLRVRLVDGTDCAARVIALDKESDLAIIKIDPPKPLPMVRLGTAQDLMLAEKVIAIGNAYGYEHTVTIGHVSAMKRDVTLNKEVSYKSLIQTQTPINPGNSGGPLFNKLGEVVGVNVAIRANAQNIAFAIPVDSMIEKAGDMLSGRRQSGKRFGLHLSDQFLRANEDGPVQRWVTVDRIENGSLGAEAGIRAGDRIEVANSLPVLTTVDFERAILELPNGSTVKLRLRRGVENINVELTNPTAMSVAVTAADQVWQKLGLKVAAVGPKLVSTVERQLRGGLWLSEVSIGSLADLAGLRKGDILIGMHQWETLNIDNVIFILNHRDVATFNPITIHVIRDGRVHQAQVKLK